MKRFLVYFIFCNAAVPLLIHGQLAAPQYLKTGKIYTPPPVVSQSSPYYKNQTFARSTIVYDRVKYENQNLVYDVASDKLVLEDGQYIEVIKQLVNYFIINGDTLVYAAAPGLPAAYYEQVYQSESASVLARHIKYLKEVMRGTLLERSYSSSVRYYVLLPGETSYLPVRSEKDLFRTESRKEIKAILRARSLHFRNRPNETLQTVLRFYETRS